MRKLKLNVANLGATEILTREELKKVLGGVDAGSGSGSGVKSCAESDCSSENLGLGCAGGKTCQWSYNYGACRCQATLA